MTTKIEQKDNKGGIPKTAKQPYRQETYNAFVEWSCLTAKEKKECGILTAKAFAKKHNVGESRLSKWKKRDDFSKAYGEAMRLKLTCDTSDVLEGLKDNCIKYGRANDVELFLLYVEGWDRKQALEKKEEVVLGQNDIRLLVDILPEEKRKKFYDTLTDLLAEAENARFHNNV